VDKLKEKSFTLIELLVVIAIIGMLSSIVLVATKGSRDKARIAKALEFSQTIHTSLGSEAVGIWDFDNCTASDASGYGNNGTINGAICSSDTPYSAIGQGTGKNSLSFDGVDDYVNVPMVQSGTYTVSLWLYRNGLSHQYIFDARSSSGTGCLYWDSGGTLIRTGGGTIYVDGVVTNILGVDDWHFVTVSGISMNIISRITIGTRYSSEMFWNGLIDDVRIYSQALSSTEIQKHYVEDLEKHKNL